MGANEIEAPDTNISYTDAIEYWTGVPATVDGVLGGFGHTTLPKTDVKGSITFIKRISRLYPEFEESGKKLGARGCDVGAGIGRVTRDVLSKFCSKVDLVEPVVPFANQISTELERKNLLDRLGNVLQIGMQDFSPEPGKYWFIWCQWCLGQLKDTHLVDFLERCKTGLQKDGLIFVKENNTSTLMDEFDSTDSSVTRADLSFRRIFDEAGLELLQAEIQQGLPHGLYPVRSYALRPKKDS
ncbi:alpha-N-methyltransferase NTM1 [Lipomyces tetrasporus]|uniref:Alpha N-terminal protein methyltransferase 1 n=1 Tax=Lipomyces tetrasporus TaxID=54092 RepID=A0AAD7VSV0_9ASCO|nr:alpha-N-methyltransferase NTM1 [Lipomyces tetrasporus]KAJ8100376.1 alpha-N-methyltransferase NTM1 [Lipomyces tetrasporus]